MESHKKAFHKKTRRGKVVRLVQERYLRTDQGCGFFLSADTKSGEGNRLSVSNIQDIVSKSPHKHLLILDTNICVHQIDLLEHDCPATANIIITQTVLAEVRHVNLGVYRRVSALMKDPKRMFIFYANHLSTETAEQRDPNESVNDFHDRSIVRCASFYKQCLKSGQKQAKSSSGGDVVFITNDVGNCKRAKEEGIQTYNMLDYVTEFLSKDYPQLADLVACDETQAIANSHLLGSDQLVFPPHLSMDKLLSGIKSRQFLRGTIRCRGNTNRSDCYILLHRKDSEERRTVLVTGHIRCNRAVDGDVVAIELVAAPEEEKDEQAQHMEQQLRGLEGGEERGVDAAAEGSDLQEPTIEALEGISAAAPANNDKKLSTGSRQQQATSPGGDASQLLYGRVVGVIRRNWKQYAGSLDMRETRDGGGGSTMVQFLPVNRKIPPVWISTRRIEEVGNSRLIVQIDAWPASSSLPYGHYTHVLGKAGDKAIETQVLLHEFDVPCEAFSEEVMSCLPPAGWKITDDIVAQRSDLRHIPVVSIDPPGCKDIDDALHCVRLPNGRLEAGVHIADVTHFVHAGSALDKEAAHRCTSTYLVERRLDMLPGYLTTELCSLRSNEDHLAFSVIWEFDDEGNVYDVKFMKSVIHSVASLTYDQGQAMLDAPDPNDQVSVSVNLLGMLARKLRQRRIDVGALTLASPEVRFKLDQETQNPTDVSIYALKEANALVEEWMLLANITVSKQMLRYSPTLAILRRHQPPSREQFAPLLSAASAVGVELDISSSKTFADSLDKAVRDEDPYFNKLLRILSTRCMMPAQYFCSGEVQPKEQWHHYGLAAPVYTHFTSPIRRYADVLVHRLLAASIGVTAFPPEFADKTALQETCSNMNRRHKAAQHVQRASVALHTLMYFKDKPSVETGYVLSVTATNFSVLIPRLGVENSLDWYSVLRGMVADAPDPTRDSTPAEDAAAAAAVALRTRSQLDPIAHRMSLYVVGETNQQQLQQQRKKVKTAMGTDGEKHKLALSIQVFQSVQINMEVRGVEGRDRRLVLTLVHD